MRNLCAIGAFFNRLEWGESMRISRRNRTAVRPDWLPRPLVMNFILALWVAVAALRVFAGPHF